VWSSEASSLGAMIIDHRWMHKQKAHVVIINVRIIIIIIIIIMVSGAGW